MKKIGFCFLSHQAHVRHQLPIAVEFSKLYPEFQVDLLVTSDAVLAEVNENLKDLSGFNLNINMLSGTLLKTLVGKVKGRLYPNIKNVINNNEKLFFNYDALVTPHHTLDRVMELDVNRVIQYICTFHGAGDGEVGFDKRFSAYDLLLTSGRDIDRRLHREGIVHLGNESKITGYTKLENIKTSDFKCFNNDKPIFLYNPHYEPRLTSWGKWGQEVLRYFSDQDKFNLIFSPHVKLFNGKSPSYLNKYANSDSVYIDINSGRMMDATYTAQADVYLGDVSSQVYEFLYFKEKPVIFLNAQNVKNWRDDPSYQMWKMGDVIQDISDLNKVVGCAQGVHKSSYHTIQAGILKDKFSKTGVAASVLGAQALHDYITKKKKTLS